MIRLLAGPFSRCLKVFGCLTLVALLAPPAWGENLKLEAKLIWGTNEPRSPNPAHKPVDKEIGEKLQKVFKWQNYFIVKTVVKVVPSRGSNKFVLSDKCTIEVTELEGPKVEVKLIGEGKEVHKAIKGLSRKEWFTYAGDDKNDTAWFVIIRQLD